MSPLARDSQRRAVFGIDPTAVLEIQLLTNCGIGDSTDHNIRETFHLTDRSYIIYPDLRLSTVSEPGKIP